jgi:hypothetical protein
MSGTNNFLLFADQASNLESQSNYVSDNDRLYGNKSGNDPIARSSLMNKVLRQTSKISTVVAQFIVDYANVTASDTDSVSTLETEFVAGINAVARANNLSQFAATTSSQLASVISDETGSGSLVFSTSPTLVTPSIGVATGTSFNSITGLSSITPSMDGTATIGTSTTVARADHIHPTDTSRAPIASPTFTGTVGGITKTMVGLGNVDNTTDLNKPISTATQSALDLKAPLASPTFTGTVSGITKSMVGLGNVSNTDTTTTANITDSTNKRFVSDAQVTVLGNTSGTNTGDETTSSIKTKLGITTLSGSNTGDQTITLTGDVTGSGTGSFSATLANSGVTAGTYNNSATAVTPITVDSKGRVTGTGSAVTITPAFNSLTSKPTTLSGYGITDAYTQAQVNTLASNYYTQAQIDSLASNYALLASPAFTGTPTAPTPTAGDNSTKVATTAYVLGQAASTNPNMDGTAAIGTATTFARADHTHPSDTSKQATLVSGTNIKTVGGNSLLGSGDVPFAVTSVNGMTGAVTVSSSTSANSIGATALNKGWGGGDVSNSIGSNSSLTIPAGVYSGYIYLSTYATFQEYINGSWQTIQTNGYVNCPFFISDGSNFKLQTAINSSAGYVFKRLNN